MGWLSLSSIKYSYSYKQEKNFNILFNQIQYTGIIPMQPSQRE